MYRPMPDGMTTEEWMRQPPIRAGNVYCSPWCGRGCTIQEYEIAKALASNMAEGLELNTGLTWNKRVWENMGWYSSAERGKAQIFPMRSLDIIKRITGYHCIINASGISVCVSGATPFEAFDLARNGLRERLVAVGRDFAEIGGF